jgi:putative transposase
MFLIGLGLESESGVDSPRSVNGRCMAKWLNRVEGKKGRKVWHNFWETRLTFEKAYLARLSYVHRNAVRHGLVNAANNYPWCSAAWFERVATPAQVRTIYGMKIDAVSVIDSYEPHRDW